MIFPRPTQERRRRSRGVTVRLDQWPATRSGHGNPNGGLGMSTNISTIDAVTLQRAVYVVRSGKPVATATLVLDDADGIDLSCHIDAGHLPVGVREELVDAIFAVPEVQARHRIRATIPLGDPSLLDAIRVHCSDLDTRGAGASCLIDARVCPRVS